MTENTITSAQLEILARRFETYDFEGKKYTAKEEMQQTNRVFPGWYGDAEEGDSYTDEWSADGYDEDGNEVCIIMRFEQVRGEELEPDQLNWNQDAADIIKA